MQGNNWAKAVAIGISRWNLSTSTDRAGEVTLGGQCQKVINDSNPGEMSIPKAPCSTFMFQHSSAVINSDSYQTFNPRMKGSRHPVWSTEKEVKFHKRMQKKAWMEPINPIQGLSPLNVVTNLKFKSRCAQNIVYCIQFPLHVSAAIHLEKLLEVRA